MAKKSAKSKGFRKTTGKKPYLTRKDIITLCVLLVIVAIGAIMLFSYDDGALKTKDNRIVDPGENWLIINGSSNGRRYFKVGEVGDIEGCTRDAQPILTDINLPQYTYTPEGDDAGFDSITVFASPYDPRPLAESASGRVRPIDGFDVSEVGTSKAGDVEYTWYSYTRAYVKAEEAAEEAAEATEEAAAETVDAAEEAVEAAGEATAEAAEETAEAAGEATEETAEAAEAAEATEDAAEEETEPNTFEQCINAYVPSSRGCVVISALRTVDSPDDYATEEQLHEIAAKAIGAITIDAK